MDSGSELPVAEPPTRPVRLIARLAALGAALLLARSLPAFAQGESLVMPEDVGRVLVLENVTEHEDRVSGVIVNQSDHRVHDVRLQIVYAWLWADEHRQGTNDPSFVATEIVHDEIPPHGNMSFGYSYPSALTLRTDGKFLVDVRIAGFATISETRTTP